MTSINVSAGAAKELAKINDRKQLASDPEKGLVAAANYPEPAKDERTPMERLIPFSEGSKKIFSLRTAAIFGGLALAVGGAALLLGGPTMLAALAGVVGAHGASAVVTAAIAAPKVATTMLLTTSALFGATMGIDLPTMSANATEFVGKIFQGKNPFSKEPAPALPIPQSAPIMPKITVEEAAALQEKLAAGAPDKNFTQTIITQQMQAPSALQV
jgi:hypothetical protein